mgnify:CR=1 FL=1
MFAHLKMNIESNIVACLRIVSTMFAHRKYHVYASLMACLQSSNDGVCAFKHALQMMQEC